MQKDKQPSGRIIVEVIRIKNFLEIIMDPMKIIDKANELTLDRSILALKSYTVS